MKFVNLASISLVFFSQSIRNTRKKLQNVVLCHKKLLVFTKFSQGIAKTKIYKNCLHKVHIISWFAILQTILCQSNEANHLHLFYEATRKNLLATSRILLRVKGIFFKILNVKYNFHHLVEEQLGFHYQ